ncbi:MAG TPA: class I SAM-dependent methyltransferase [Arenimonas sp.]
MNRGSTELDRITDAGFRARYVDVPDTVAAWVPPHIELGQADVLDFGCGEGVAALGMLRRKGVRSLLGVDIMPDPARCLPVAREQIGLDVLPDNLELQQIEPGADFAPGRQFDLIYSWSVFEHVEQPRVVDVLAMLRGKLKPGGRLFIQIDPLYYSADGSHLYHRIPEPWAHLRDQESVYYDKLCRACDSPEEVAALWSCYQWLNKMTAAQLREHLQEVGFVIEREHFSKFPEDVPADLIRVYQRNVLEAKQLVYLARVADHSPGMPGASVARRLLRKFRA